MRKKLIAANWKMNKLQADLEEWFSEFNQHTRYYDYNKKQKVDIIVAVPYLLLEKAQHIAKNYGIRIASQNLHYEMKGAFTGEISIPMLKEIGINCTIIGHSERRQYFGETDENVAKKLAACLAHNITPIVCIGEYLEQRKQNQTLQVIKQQMNALCTAINDPKDMIIAYEPVWAIGTGLTATNEQAQEVHAVIRNILSEYFGNNVAQTIKILYGGSAKPNNIKELIQQPDIDGSLVGGASLNAKDFGEMVNITYETVT